jgi:Fic family protein
LAQFTQLDPAFAAREHFEALAIDLARESGLTPALPEQTLRAVRDVMRLAEAHYSLSIDGHRVHPAHIEEAVRGELNPDATVRGLQREAVAYLKAERFVAARIADEPQLDLSAAASLKVVHWELYARVPEEFRWIEEPGPPCVKLRIVAGELRAHATSTRQQLVDAEMVEEMLGCFRGLYELNRLSPVERIIAAAGAHHRLLWIRPFTGGNGRVARLYTASFLQRAGINGALLGVWSMSRGLARARDRYRVLLRAADQRHRNDLEGRDLLSPRALADFTRFFLETCREEIAFMRQALRADTLMQRINHYVGLRSTGLAPGGQLHPESASLLRDVAIRGEVPRGDAARITGMAISEARKVLSALVKERLLVSNSPKGPVRIGLPSHAVPFLIPDLYPGELAFQGMPRSAIEAA